MDNNAKNRIKALQKLSFKPWLSEIEISTQTETHFIGFGSGGANAVKYIWSQRVKAQFTVVNDQRGAEIPEGIKLIPFISPKILKFTGKYGDITVPDMAQPLVLPDELTELFHENCRFVLLASLGGYTGTKMAEALSLMLHNAQKDYITICSVPYRFEGRNNQLIALEAIERMKTIPNCHIFELDQLKDEQEDMLLCDAFPAGDRYFYRIVYELLFKQ